MRIYNTLTRKKEELKTITPGEVKIYACGPTVYNYIHIGNARPLCAFDTLRRYLEFRGYKVKFVQNFTDIDDKIIKKRLKRGRTTKPFPKNTLKNFGKMRKDSTSAKRPSTRKRRKISTKLLRLSKLWSRKATRTRWKTATCISAPKFLGIRQAFHQPLEDLEAGARINIGELKKDPMDFALWKGAKPGEPYWPSPWGNGRPGWHIECSAMVRRYLGDTIDIHCGGQDLIFPHHENEIAQSECCNGVPFANYWMHNGYINVDNVKMSKSLGNFFTVRDVAEKYGYEPIRYLMISSHYRSPINYSVDIIDQCKASLTRLHTCRDSLDFALNNAGDGEPENAAEIRAQMEARKQQFIEAMDDDLNTADGLAAVFELVRDINVSVLQSGSKALITDAIKLFDELTGVLGIVYPHEKEETLDDDIEKLIEARQAARKAKNWAEADRIRDELKDKGIVLEDTPKA